MRLPMIGTLDGPDTPHAIERWVRGATLRQRVHDVVNDSELEDGALWNGLCLALAWGAWLLLPFQTFASADAYRAIAYYAPEPVWGLLFFSAGVWQIGAMFYARRANGYKMWRWATLLVTVCWAFLASLLLIGNPAGIGWLLHVLLCLSNWNRYRRLCRAIPNGR